MQLDDAATILAHADFFEVCTQDERRLLAFASERKKYRPGSVIYEAGEVPDGAHVLVSGTVSTTQSGAEDNPFIVHQQGAVLGAMALVVAKARPVTVKAIDSVETLFVPTNPTYSFLSSSLVKEVATWGGDVSHLVPPLVLEALAERLRQD